MKQHLCRVVENRVLWSGVQIVACDAPELAFALHPGQCALVRDPTTYDPYLRRTAWLYHSYGERVSFSLPAQDPIVTRAAVGALLDVLAPVGRPLGLEDKARHVLLIAEDERASRLVPFATSAVGQGRPVVLWMSAQSEQESLPPYLLPPEVEYRTDSEIGRTGLIEWADVIFASGSERLYRTIGEAVRTARYRLEPGRVFVLLDPAMPCGTGACYACAIATGRGVRLACTDGPLFDLFELEIRRAR